MIEGYDKIDFNANIYDLSTINTINELCKDFDNKIEEIAVTLFYILMY